MQIARKASLGLALLGLVAGLAFFPKAASAQVSVAAPDPTVFNGVTFAQPLTVTNADFVSLTITDATVTFTKTQPGFQTTDFTSTFTGPDTIPALTVKTVDVLDGTFTSAPLGVYTAVLDVTYYLDHNPSKTFTATSSQFQYIVEAAATPEPTQTVALMIGALGIGGLILARRRNSLRA